MKRLSKSRNTLFCQCPKALWLKTNKPDEPSLNCHNLDERCQNGGNAMNLFPLIEHMPPEEVAASREALLHYCELNILAMVKVWEKLKEVSKNRSSIS